MGLSFRNIIDQEELSNAIISGDFSKVLKKPNSTRVKYIRGYAKENGIESLAKAAGLNKGLFKQVFGLEDKEVDAYDPYHLEDSKKEEFWKMDGKVLQKNQDIETDFFKRGLYEEFNYKSSNTFYEDPLLPSFEVMFDRDSPLFTDNMEGINVFLKNYQNVDENYAQRELMLIEFKKMIFQIFNDFLKSNENRNIKNKSYYVTKINGLENLNKKFIKYGEDKITITLNEDVSMIAWYISELYNNLIYSYKYKKYMFPENVLKFTTIIKINDIRNFQIPTYDKRRYKPSKKSTIYYKLEDCNFIFTESRNHGNDIIRGGYSAPIPSTPSELSFDIIFKSVSRTSEFPLIQYSKKISSMYLIGESDEDIEKTTENENEKIKKEKKRKSELDKYKDNPNILIAANIAYKALDNKERENEDKITNRQVSLDSSNGDMTDYFKEISRIKTEEQKSETGFIKNLIKKGVQTVTNTAFDYADNLETSLRNARGNVVNDLLSQFRKSTPFNKIEPDNVYLKDFNNRSSVKNFGEKLGSGLLNNLEDTLRDMSNF